MSATPSPARRPSARVSSQGSVCHELRFPGGMVSRWPTIVAGERVAELTWPLLLAYMHPAEAAARWERINADGSRVVIILRPASVTGRQQVR